MANQELKNLIARLKIAGVLKTPAIIGAFLKIDRKDFLPENLKNLAYLDEALAIGEGQTISQPYTVAFMLELLEPKAGDKIMDIGAGSGWQTAILAEIVAAGGKTLGVSTSTPSVKEPAAGKVYAIERLPELCAFGKDNVSKYNFIESGIVEWFCQDASSGLLQFMPFDKIIVAAEVDKIPESWKKQLKVGGKIVAPIKNSIWLFIKNSEAGWKTKEYPGFVFVPFIKN
ncbi:MAG: protein-L-isoaspartate O-methyltransferase [Patescibacteria group bacterium]